MSLDLPQLATVLADLVRRGAPSGYVAAALVGIDREGSADVLSCGVRRRWPSPPLKRAWKAG